MWLRFEVTGAWNGARASAFLRGQGMSAALLRRIKTEGPGILLDGVPIYAGHTVAAGQTVSVLLPDEQDTSVSPQPIPLRIAYENDQLALIDKPAGMTVHPTLGYADGTLANAWMGRLAQRGEKGVFRPVNRLDKDTSGLVVCAKNAFSAALLAGEVEKRYLAIVCGELPPGSGEIDAPIARCEDSIIRRRVHPSGQPSCTRYTVLAAGGGYSAVRLHLLTGRTHQIRLHMAHIGHPLAGDWLYGYGPTDTIHRHALHCFAVHLPETMQAPEWVFSAPPPDFQRLYRLILDAKRW